MGFGFLDCFAGVFNGFLSGFCCCFMVFDGCCWFSGYFLMGFSDGLLVVVWAV